MSGSSAFGRPVNPSNDSNWRERLRPARLAAGFLFPLRDEHRDDEAAWRRAAGWLPVWGLLIGVAYSIVYRASWRWFGEFERFRLMPVACLLLADLVWCGYRLIASLVTVVDHKAAGQDSGPGAAGTGARPSLSATLAVGLVVLFKLTMLLSLPLEVQVWPADWRSHLGPLYPYVIFRPLVLMPLWGRWGMMLAISMGRAGPAATIRLQNMMGGTRLPAVMLYWVLAGALTVFYLSPTLGHLASGIVVAIGVLLAAYLTSFALSRRAGGQTEATIRVAGLSAELSFLAFYLPIASAIYWYPRSL
ncbi:MAG: hypothetical protein AMXMBFR13_40760 [Phycisphaerae bacterium]